MSDKRQGTSSSGWRLASDHDHCAYSGCTCECHEEQTHTLNLEER